MRGSAPEYNTVDAALWYVEAIRACAAATRDPEFARDVSGGAARDRRRLHGRYALRHRRRSGATGSLRAGVPGVQLTWMDAKVGDDVITPRIGKPVEINALWFAALQDGGGRSPNTARTIRMPFEEAAARVRESFDRFWNAERGCCFDVIDGPDGDDPAIRPEPALRGRARARNCSRPNAAAPWSTCACASC